MPYPIATQRRIPYDLIGTIVGHSASTSKVFTSFLTKEEIASLNKTGGLSYFLTNADYREFCFVFPEKYVVTGITISIYKGREDAYIYGGSTYIQGSEDTANMVDGTWETASLPDGSPFYLTNTGDHFRNIKRLSFAKPVKALRLGAGVMGYLMPISIHIYGYKAAGETPDDIIFCASNGNELTALNDWGDRTEGTSLISETYIKNISATKTANNINLSINHADFLISFNQTSWTTSLNISSLVPGAISSPIYIKNTIGPSPQVLRPVGTPLVATIGSWA